MVISDGIPAVPRNRKPRNSGPNPSAEEKTTRNSVPLNKNRSELSEFPSDHFSGRENNSEFLSVALGGGMAQGCGMAQLVACKAGPSSNPDSAPQGGVCH
jgi:hypothetical protein